VVATEVGGLPEIVDDGQTGYLVPPRNETQLADAVVRLLIDPSLRQRMGTNGKRKIETQCAPEVVAQETLAVYRRVINRAMPVSSEIKRISATRPQQDSIPPSAKQLSQPQARP
jgi:glycogen synthase